MRIPFSNLKFENWQNLFLVLVLFFYLSLFGFNVGEDGFLMGHTGAYLAFWSAGKIADEKGYAEIYDLENLRTTQAQELITLGFLEKSDESNFAPLPAPFFSFFVLPFQLLSRVNLELGYWIWIIVNLAVLVGYLIFFLRKTHFGDSTLSSSKKMLFLMLLSYPVFVDLTQGQVDLFLVVCVGEFIRHALNKKPLLSGLWLGGLLLKPQLLILIIPIFLILRNRKTLMGFVVSSGIILLTSFTLSGLIGMKSLLDLWTRYAIGMVVSNPGRMINWRMVAVNLNALLNTSIGWVIAGLGIALTILTCVFLAKRKPAYGTSRWVMTMLGIFSATLAITWDSHYYLAVVLIPFLIYASLSHLLPAKVVFSWVIMPPVILIVIGILAICIPLLLPRIDINASEWMIIAFCGFVLNLFILIYTLRSLHSDHIPP